MEDNGIEAFVSNGSDCRYYTNREESAMTKKRTDKKMVARNKILSMPRFVLKTLPAPPNTVPRPVPFCCNKMAAMSVIPTIT